MARLRAILRALPGAGLARRTAAACAFPGRYLAFRRLAAGRTRLALRWRERLACPDDATRATAFDRHYILHCAWAARILARTAPPRHLDIGSSLAFAAQVSAFVPVEFRDFRPPALALPGLTVGRADLTCLELPSGSVASLSCMHTVEHVGLGRYGDALDYDGDLKAMAELARILAPGGDLLFVVPVGAPRIVFNAHRIYAAAQVVDAFAALELRDFTLIPDDPVDGDLVAGPSDQLVARQRYGCGCFWFRRPA